jgi:hypothetical protein
LAITVLGLALARFIAVLYPRASKQLYADAKTHLDCLSFLNWSCSFAQRLLLWSTVLAVTTIQTMSPWLLLLSSSKSSTLSMTDNDEVKKHDNLGQADIVSNLLLWAQNHQTAAEQAQRLSQTEDWVDALFDVHGHQIFNLGLFNGKCST